MSLVHWNPVSELSRLQDDFNRILGGLFSGEAREASLTRGAWAPAVNISETDKDYSVTAELPGLGKDDVNVNYEDGVLSIHGEKYAKKDKKGKNYHRVECSYGIFERSFRLASRVVVNKIDAKFKDGILTLTLPKAEEAQPKQIPIKIN